ncbi:MAG: cephalosporin hydroxylase [Gemmatimonadetes bacterium]|nr:cephalosporin hydroxylase [Gemmatimonadota bacterium]
MSIFSRLRRRKQTPSVPADIAVRHHGVPGQRLEVDKWAASEIVLELVKIVGTIPYSLDELMLMTAAFGFHRPATVVDIGTHVGKSARIWYELSRRLEVKATIHTIDLHNPDHPEYADDSLGSFVRGLPVIQHLGDGYIVARSILTDNPAGPVLLYIDGDHRQNTVETELRLVQLITTGCALVHDTFWQPGSPYNHGPHLAVEKLLSTTASAQIIRQPIGLPGMTYIGV